MMRLLICSTGRMEAVSTFAISFFFAMIYVPHAICVQSYKKILIYANELKIFPSFGTVNSLTEVVWLDEPAEHCSELLAELRVCEV